MFNRYMEALQRTMTRQQLGKEAVGTDYSEVDGQPSLVEFKVTKPYAFRADEYGPATGRFHLHALIGNVKTVAMYCGRHLPAGFWGKSCCALHQWPCGYARLFAYDPQLGARFYLSKYVTKAMGDWQLVGFESPPEESD